MRNALSILILAQASLACVPGVRADPAQPSNKLLQEEPSLEVERDGDRGYREAEPVLAAATDIRSTTSSYLRRVADESQSAACRESNQCSYQRHFDISVRGKTRLALLFTLRLSESAETICGDRRPDSSCEIAVSIFIAGDEAFPHCVAVQPILQAAIRHGWSIHPYRHPPHDENVSRYRHEDDGETYLFIRTMGDERCFRSFHIARFPA